MNEEYFKELKAIIFTAIKEASAGEMADEDNAESTAEFILRLGYMKKKEIPEVTEEKKPIPTFQEKKKEQIVKVISDVFMKHKNEPFCYEGKEVRYDEIAQAILSILEPKREITEYCTFKNGVCITEKIHYYPRSKITEATLAGWIEEFFGMVEGCDIEFDDETKYYDFGDLARFLKEKGV